MKKNNLLTLILTLFPFIFISAQTNKADLPVIIPAGPNAAELSKYGNIDVGLQTGSLNFTTPLFAIEGNQWKMPIDIQYSTTGIKVDQMASRVGMGWSLNAGGVITRSVNHNPDEKSTRSLLPADWTNFTESTLIYLQNIVQSNAMDTEPDEFSYNFNGVSGKFIFDANMNVVQLKNSGVRMSFIFNAANSVSSFVCTTQDGAIYYFEDIEYTSVNSVGGMDNSPVGPAIATAWYLTKAVLPNKEVVNFTYNNINYDYLAGISQTLTRSLDLENQNPCPSLQCPIIDSESTNMTLSMMMGKILSKITFRSMEASFEYISRLDFTSSSNSMENQEQLLSRITLKNNGELLKSFDFSYQYGISNNNFQSAVPPLQNLRYRPYLQFVSYKGANGGLMGKQTFGYNDINGMPHRLSFSQDAFGFFNGKLNSSLIQKPELISEQNIFWRATADRSANFTSTLKGALVKVGYLTGGTDSIVYELNDYRGVKTTYPDLSVPLSIARNPVYPQERVSAPFSVPNPNTAVLSANMLIEMGSDGSSPFDPITNLMQVEIIRQSDQQQIYSKMLQVGQGYTESLASRITSGTLYVLKITCLVPNLRCTAVINYTGAGVDQESNVLSAGLRVSKLISKSNSAAVPVVKKYYYAGLADLSKSSGKAGYASNLFSGFITYQAGGCAPGPPPSKIAYFQCKNRVAYSNSMVNSFAYSQNFVYYQEVVEGLGENFENGGTSHKYIVQRDKRSVAINGPNPALGVKLSNSGILNGLEQEQVVFEKKNGAFNPLKKTVNSYKSDPSFSSVSDAYLIIKDYDFPVSSHPPFPIEFEGYQIHQYKFYSSWVYKDTTTVYDYHADGNTVVSKTAYEYPNFKHALVGKVTTTSSENKVTTVSYKYPSEMVSEGRDPSGVYQAMVSNYVLQPVIEERQLKDGVQTSFSKVNYGQPYPQQFYPDFIQLQSLAGNPLETRLRYWKYDSKGNLLSVSREKGPQVTYLYSYNNSYPFAEIKNMDYSTVEAALGGAAAVQNFANLAAPTQTMMLNFLAPLKSGQFDNQISLYTYKPLIGMSSQTDNKGMTTYYEYDEFQRLRLVKDQYGNIIKNNIYHYQN